MASIKERLGPFKDHLEFFGYNCVFDENGVGAFHPTKPYLRCYPLGGDVALLSPFAINETAKKDRAGFLEFLNQANAKTGVCKYYENNGNLFIQATYVGEYERPRFGQCFDDFLGGVAALRELLPVEISKYFDTPKQVE
jgi:hypothetical protein